MNTIEQLTERSAKMQEYLEKTVPSEPNDIIDRLTYLTQMVAISGQLLAEAKYYQDTIVNGAIMEALQKAYEERLSPSTINKFVTTSAKDKNFLVNWLDRINSSAVHQIDGLRSILSYRKAEMSI